ncbi:MAG: nucleotidyltransferase substrate binding protein [Oscillospiraceae bacterium]|jgi:nucleotidyltransferase substrate binding protein (TIGR01987 family)|nr:nucleotidyltransferase substrate binding protein [Oscillospiraceae bacterium]
MPDNDTRWKQRLTNFKQAHSLLSELYSRDLGELNIYERESYIHRFTMTFDLAWKTLADYLQYSGLEIPVKSPRSVIKEAFAAGILQDGDAFIDMLQARNLLTHIYDEVMANAYLVKIKTDYLPPLTALTAFIENQIRERED